MGLLHTERSKKVTASIRKEVRLVKEGRQDVRAMSKENLLTRK
jgi:hypothetical protein